VGLICWWATSVTGGSENQVLATITALMTEAASTSETSVSFYGAKRCNIPEENNFHIRRHKNLELHLTKDIFSHT
jgi:hypothetical protein